MLRFGETYGPCIGMTGETWSAPSGTVCAEAGLKLDLWDTAKTSSGFVTRVALTTQAAANFTDSFYVKLFFTHPIDGTDISVLVSFCVQNYYIAVINFFLLSKGGGLQLQFARIEHTMPARMVF